MEQPQKDSNSEMQQPKIDSDTEKQHPQNDSPTNDGDEAIATEVIPNCLIKPRKWTLWRFTANCNQLWEKNQTEVTSFDTVEDFRSLYNNIKSPSKLELGCDYSVFKDNLRPFWEDEANVNGGRWMLYISQTKGNEVLLDSLWFDVVTKCLIGEAFENSNDICGAVVNVRNGTHKIAIWNANGSDKQGILSIGHKLKELLGLKANFQIRYKKNTQKASIKTKPSYVI